MSPQKKEKVKKIIIFWTRQSFYQKRVLLVVVELLSKFAACDDFTRDDDDDDDDAKTSFPGKSDEEMYHRARAFCGGAVVRGAAPSRGQSRRDGRDEWRDGTV